ncbi:MAG: 7-carboxy-7-deazaguanine synthase QueE [Gammaproteobacteria bacterium]|nr:7-carboxy-7-deazaguanine synthase QueE [Gammaproteobacteria bacterium]MBT8057596.1 7-carboxy-7-deazaguanine synthase QueE [Gammaproteobacteria bacterium]NNJ78969.1 7-carboxy-7-deazaguanine synthase QueE [Xanthomonadales bacterium]
MTDSAPPENRKGYLKITEIFHSLQGEALQSGLPTVFVRLTGCPLRCTYCDSEYAFYGGEWMHYEEILAEIGKYGSRYVCVTGGEPLAQKRCKKFLEILCDKGFEVSLETSGAMDIARADRRVSRVMDLKTPASREQSSNRWANLEELTAHDQIKFVICSRRDYEWAREQVAGRDLADYCEVLFSPAWGLLDPAELAEWILEDQLPVRFQLQLHKLLWGDQPGK